MKKDRHQKVEVTCDWCGISFLARKERVDAGLGRFCSKPHFHLWRNRESKENIWGRKDLATIYKSGDRHIARWYDENGKSKSCTYPRWWWEMNVGEIPNGMIVLYKDNDPSNISPDNFILGTKSDALVAGTVTRKSDINKWNQYTSKLREKSTGRIPSNETRKKMSISGRVRTTGRVSGKDHYRWRGGVLKEYPKEFYEIREFVINRDYSKCQICSKDLEKNIHVHHRDGVREHNESENLITLCASCHGKVHSNNDTESFPIMSLRAELSWNR